MHFRVKPVRNLLEKRVQTYNTLFSFFLKGLSIGKAWKVP